MGRWGIASNEILKNIHGFKGYCTKHRMQLQDLLTQGTKMDLLTCDNKSRKMHNINRTLARKNENKRDGQVWESRDERAGMPTCKVNHDHIHVPVSVKVGLKSPGYISYNSKK